MTRDRTSDDTKKLANLDKFVEEQLFATTDEELLREASEDGIDLTKLRNEHLASLSEAGKVAGRNRQAAIRDEMARDRAKPPAVLDLNRARSKYEQLLAGNDNAATRMTMAARNQDGDAEADMDGMLEDFAELGLIKDADKDKPGP
ncbi:hypothetical protein [Lichenifustis flavocetrariae]|uniref:Uncharacterized protein n=1 Tax=Lichenifustis flavocetrariae TaxID=2949735 RepID=A0AA42CJU9_9HYPH|nr:hypothetical protein [Lichenifustis flavocetrariae]MCW6509874.1 hypothetical protein [Lichenifustis flavocetrariae]